MSRNRNMVWGCYFPKVQADKTWIDNDSGGLKPVTINQCLTFNVEKKDKLTLQKCSELKGNEGQKIHVVGNKGMTPCSKAGLFCFTLVKTKLNIWKFNEMFFVRNKFSTPFSVRSYSFVSEGIV